LKSMLSCSESLMGSYCEFSNCILDKWSTTKFSTPFLSFISNQILRVTKSILLI
jgi:hypothetical protein